ncbi:centromere protein J-like isoform X3 [Crotalus tigris]|uniref:centromere protein J-like isoform X3 n=1 Tax=Crotalus tigris TaxID=88082 RepID=UPI00192F44B4|nr:centromere protein J-like isoform X3 [Crotalus tigris]
MPPTAAGLLPVVKLGKFQFCCCSFPLENSRSHISQGTETNMDSLPQSYETNKENASRYILEEQKNGEIREFWSECLPSITEEREEQSIEANIPLSPSGLGTNVKTQIVDDRSVRPGVGKRQKNMEKSIEELKVDSPRIEIQYQNSSEAEITDPNSFLEYPECIVKHGTNRESLTKSPTKLLGRVSFDHHNLSSPDQWKIGKQLGKCLRLERKVMFPDDKSTNCFISNEVVKCQYNKYEPRSESRKESNPDYDDEEMVSEKESELPFNWSKSSQQWHEQLSEVKAQVDEKNDSSSPSSKEHSGIVFGGSTISKIPVWLMEDLDGDVSQVTGNSRNPSLDVSDFQNIEWKQPNPEDQSSKFQIIQCTQRIGQCKNKCYVETDECSDTKLERNPGFKKINDQIINVTTKPEINQGMTPAKSQMKHHDNANAGKRWNGKSPSSDSFCISTDNDLLCPPCLTRCGLHRTSKDGELSDGDYATDEPSEAEDYVLKSCGKLFPKKPSAQELMSQKETPQTTSSSSSESSLREGCLKYEKPFSSRMASPFHPQEATRDQREPEILIKSIASSYGGELNWQALSLRNDLVARLFPVFKSKANPEHKKEQAPKRQIAKPEEQKWEDPVSHRETSLLAQMKDEQTKAMDFLSRRQISQYDAVKTHSSHLLEECKSQETWKLSREKPECQTPVPAIEKEEESEQIRMLKKQIAGLQEEFRRNKIHWQAAHSRLRSQVELLTKQNLALQDEFGISEHQKMETQRKHGAVDVINRRSETPLSAAILRGTSSQESAEERTLQDNHKSLIDVQVRRKISFDDLAHKDNAQATRRTLLKSESQKTARGEQRTRSSSKMLNNRSLTPTGQRTPPPAPFQIQKASPRFTSDQQQNHGRNTPISVSNRCINKNTVPSLYVKGVCSSTSGTSEDAAFSNSLNTDILNSTPLTDVELQMMENVDHKRAQRFKKASRPQSVPANGRKTPEGNLSTLEKTEKKPTLLRRASSCIESKVGGEVKEEIKYLDGKVKQLFTDGRRITTYPNGTKMEISTDKKTATVTFYNGDIKKILADQTVIYYYADAQTTRTIYQDGLEVLQFPNDQIEKYHPDGTEEIIFPNQTVKRRYGGGFEETIFPDGTVVKVETNGEKTIYFRNGQKEIQASGSKRREYPDGTVKTVYANGQWETKNVPEQVQIQNDKEVLILDE